MIFHTPLSAKELYDIRIWQCTDFARHWHSNTEVYICLQGQMKIDIEGTLYHLNKDDAVFVFGNEAHEIFCNEPNTLVVLIGFGYAVLGNDYNRIQNLSLSAPFFSLKDNKVSPQILQPLRSIIEILLHPEDEDFLDDWKIRSCIYAIATYMFQNKQNSPIATNRLLRTKHLEKIFGILQYISEHFRENITVEQASTFVGYDRSYFCKQFFNATGMTFHRYLNHYRISKACHLLTDARLPLSAVAEKSGFSCQKNLSRIFRDMLGLTPTQYRNLPQEEKNHLKTIKNIFE